MRLCVLCVCGGGCGWGCVGVGGGGGVYKTLAFTIQSFVSRRLRSLRCFSHFDRVQGWFDKEYESDAFTVSPVVRQGLSSCLPLTPTAIEAACGRSGERS